MAAGVSEHDFHVSERIQHLAEPKTIKDVWNYSSKIVSGNQETLWPVSQRALTAQPKERILDLAKPKKKFDRKLQKRPFNAFSYDWGSERRELSMPSERLLHLSVPKQYSPIYLEKRPRSSPLWPVSSSALSCIASQRLQDLSQPRALNSSFILPKEPEAVISGAALATTASPRTQSLAQPVVKKRIPCYENRCMEAPIRKVKPGALQAVASPRITELARPKPLPANSSPDRSAEWPVSRAAKKVVASRRIEELAQRPIRASTNFVQFNPEAFTVKASAKRARCTDRIRKLAEPIMR